MSDDDLVPVRLQAYEDEADLDIGDNGTVQNHDELVNSGQTYTEVRALTRASAVRHDLMVVEPGDSLWDDRLADLDVGDAWRAEELRGDD
ncbi:hypothetical protein Z052_01975 [Halorubrum sp. C191]|uniref:hypothetical protein n=1 Tax=Halorubrum sp. C191 TaxID=1383842 RepID=UPI000C08517E|nr:hypothetical protein [Halorubrum sp. C191]PHQ43931.1 hypothetical protein Z052_01975 [Halorubrum sp. C191]